jgi:copper homeostasis protein
MPILLEVAIATLVDARVAHAAGADRLEMNSALELGGLTPSLGTVIEVLWHTQNRLPVVVMIRPRAGGFAYSAAEFAVMRRDADLALGYGAQGIVCGMLHPSGELDVDRCGELARLARTAGRDAVFHRAFDLVPDPLAALETLIALGFTRILTSGQQSTALAGASLMAELVRRAAGRIEILAGGGVRDTNIAALLAATGVRQVHLGPFVSRPDTSGQANPALEFGAYPVTDAVALRRLRHAASLLAPGPLASGPETA